MDENVVREWKEKLPALIESYADEDIFNCDETGLNYRALSNTTMCRPGDSAKGISGSMSKQRATMLLTASRTGERMDPLIIWKCVKKPRDYPFAWHHNKKAWMTRDIFEDYLTELNDNMSEQERHIYLFMDNVSTHKKVAEYSNIKIEYLPKNTTSATQPMDQGIIKAVKDSYKRILTEYLHAECERAEAAQEDFTVQGSLKKITVTQAALWVNQAWFDELKDCTITHCFEHAGFVRDQTIVEQSMIIQTDTVQFDENLVTLIEELDFADEEALEALSSDA